jgi:beta-lactamase class C
MRGLLILWLLLCAGAASAARLDPDELTRIDALAKRAAATGMQPGFALAIVDGGQIALMEGYGRRRTDQPDPVNPRTVYRIASVSKTFAGTLVGLLALRGHYKLDAPLIDYLPEIPWRDRRALGQLSILKVVSHQTGLPGHALDPSIQAGMGRHQVRAQLGSVTPVCQPGACYSYQNVAFDFLADLSFAATGRFFEQQLEADFFLPLGMLDTSMGLDGWERASDVAPPHTGGVGSFRPLTPKPTYYRFPAAAGVNSSVRDLSLWMLAHLGHAPDVLSPALLEVVHQPVVRTQGELSGPRWRRERLRDANYGLGWRIWDYSGSKLVFHAGAVQGYRAMLGLLPEHDFGVAILWNCDCGLPAGLMPTILDAALDLPAEDWLNLDQVEAEQRQVAERARLRQQRLAAQQRARAQGRSPQRAPARRPPA